MGRDRRGEGIAEDSSSFEDLAEDGGGGARPRRADGGGIASDAKEFEGILDESTDAARRLDSDWLYQQSGHVFGPVKAKALLEMLYQGEINADTAVSTESGEFIPIRRIGVFKVHLPKVEKRLAEKRESEEQDRREAKKRTLRRLGALAIAIVILAVGSYGVVTAIRTVRTNKAEEEKQALEGQLKKQIEDLLASVTIEPPLLPLVDEPEPPPTKGDEGKPRPRKKGVARFSGGGGGTEELSRQEIMTGVAKAFTGFKRCIVEQMQRDPDSIPEEIVLTFSIGNEGDPQGISLADRGLKKSPLRPCMDTELSKVRWRRFKGEVQNVEYPITIGRH